MPTEPVTIAEWRQAADAAVVVQRRDGRTHVSNATNAVGPIAARVLGKLGRVAEFAAMRLA